MPKLIFLILFLALNFAAYFLGSKSNMGVDIEQYLLNYAQKYQGKIEDRLSDEQRILLAEHLPKIFGINYLCKYYKSDGSSFGVGPGRWLETKENDRLICPQNIQATFSEGSRARILRRSEVTLDFESGGAQINFGQNQLVLQSSDFSVRMVGESQANLVWFGVLPSETFLSCVVGQVQNQILNPLDPKTIPNNIYLGSTTCQMNTQFVEGESSVLLGDEYLALTEILKPTSTRRKMNGATIAQTFDKRQKMYQPLLDAKLLPNGNAAKIQWTTFRSGKKNCVVKKMTSLDETKKVLDFVSEQMGGEIPLPEGSQKEVYNLTCKVGIERLFTKKIGPP